MDKDLVYDDRYNDQIMQDHISRFYGKQFVEKFKNKILPDQIFEQNNSGIHATVANKSVAMRMFHTATNTDLEAEYLVSETVTEHTNQLRLYPEFFGIYYINYAYNKNKIPSKKLNCFINRSCGFRQSWLYQLIREGLLDHGHVSFWSENYEYSDLSTGELFDHFFQENTIFRVEHEKIKNQIPYKNFNLSLEDAIIDSEKSLVIETFFEETDQICFTEKTMRVLQLPRPWYLFGNPGSISKLREWGFDVFDDWVDHSYDQEEVPHQRQRLILDQIHSTIHYTESLLEEFEIRAQNNRNLLKEFQYQYFNHKEQNILDRLQNELR